MNDRSTVSHKDQVLGKLFAALEGAGDRAQVIDEFCRQYPALEKEIRGTAAVNSALEDWSGPDEQAPDRLGNFRIAREIGRGGMGVVYEAIQEPFERRVAVKVIRQSRVSEASCQRFLREQVVLTRLHQTHIVPIFAAGEEAGLTYFAMPFIEGAALDRVLSVARDVSSNSSDGSTPSLDRLAQMFTEQKENGRQSGGKRPGRSERPGRWRGSKSSRFSREYYRSVAAVMADAAEAVDHAHAAGFVHRDLKPSNLMVDSQGHCWIIDFGLAGLLNGEPGVRPGELSAVGSDLTHGAVGTVSYMAPEQFAAFDDGDRYGVDHRSDVWGLGTTLYELLTLQRAFDGESFDDTKKQICEGQTPQPRRADAAIPKDLDAICTKCLRKPPENRYASGHKLAGDLRRWLSGEPTHARPARLTRTIWLWARREKAMAIAMAVAILFALSAISLVSWAFQVRAATAERTLQIHDILLRRFSEHDARWSQTNEANIHQLAIDGIDDQLRDEATANMAGLDVRPYRKWPDRSATGVMFDAASKRLMIGGLGTTSKEDAVAAIVCDLRTKKVKTASTKPGGGPIGFDDQGHALQLLSKEGPELLLWDTGRQRALGTFTFPPPPNQPATWRLAKNDLETAVCSFSSSGKLVAASAVNSSANELEHDDGVTCVWNVKSDEPIARIPLLATSLAFSPDDRLLAVGAENGKVVLWGIDDGEKVAAFDTGRMRVSAVNFSSKLPWQLAPVETDQSDTLLLAAGGTGGHLSVWDVVTEQRVSDFHGSDYDVYAIDFSPDGTLLASSGRHQAKLWNVRNGELFLTIPSGNYISGIDFSPSGQRLAISTITEHGSPGDVSVFDIQYGRGISTLCGLNGRIRQIAFSEESPLFAALSDNWEIGIYDLDAAALVRLFAAPKAKFGDNASIALSRDGDQLAFAGGDGARLWDVAAGVLKNRWDLPPGLQDHLVFHTSGKLLSFRVETKEGQLPPFSNVKWQQHPRVCRIRDLKRSNWREPLNEYTRFNRGVSGAKPTLFGDVFIADGIEVVEGVAHRRVVALDGLTQRELWVESSERNLTAYLVPDAAEQLVGFAVDDPHALTLVEPKSKTFAGTMSDEVDEAASVYAFHSRANWWLRLANDERKGYLLFRRNSTNSVLRLASDTPATQARRFSHDGTHIAFGHTDGTVSVYDLPTINDGLSGNGMGW